MKLIPLLQALLLVAPVAALLWWLSDRRRAKDVERLIRAIRAESDKLKDKHE